MRHDIGRWRKGWLIFLVSLLMISASAYAETILYVYIDENGVYHFSQQKLNNKYKRYKVWKNEGFIKDFNAGKYDAFIQEMGRTYGIDPRLIKAVIKAESNWDHTAVSSAGAMGLMQLMPATADNLAVADPFNPYQNIEAGVRYLRRMMDMFNGDIILALAAYNAGPNAVKKYKGVPPYAETRNYIKIVMRYYAEYCK